LCLIDVWLAQCLECWKRLTFFRFIFYCSTSLFFAIVTCALCTATTRKASVDRRQLSLVTIPVALEKNELKQLSTKTTSMLRLLHNGLLLDIACTSCIFLLEASVKSYSLSPSSSPSSPSSPHPPTVVFHTFLPSFMKSYTISMHHAAIITPGIVALRRLDNFVEVFIMVSMIFYPFLLMRALTGNNALDIGLSFVHSSVKMINIVLAILLRTSYARNIIRNLKFDLNSFSTLKPTL
jgi:hypothetical protein